MRQESTVLDICHVCFLSLLFWVIEALSLRFFFQLQKLATPI